MHIHAVVTLDCDCCMKVATSVQGFDLRRGEVLEFPRGREYDETNRVVGSVTSTQGYKINTLEVAIWYHRLMVPYLACFVPFFF